MFNNNNLALYALANCCKDRNVGTLEKYRVDRQLNLVSLSEHGQRIYLENHINRYYNYVGDVLILLTRVSHTAHVLDIGWTSVRLSVCPSHAGIVSKRLNLSSNCLHCLVAP